MSHVRSAYEPRAVKIKADKETCVGAGECQRLVPDAFDSDDEGYVVVRESADGLEVELLRRAERGCPAHAITIFEDE